MCSSLLRVTGDRNAIVASEVVSPSMGGDDVFRVTQLAGPAAREAEEQVAKYIEEQVALYDQRDLGTRTRRDGNGGLRVDFTYDAAMPPVAMEITSLLEPALRALGTALQKLEAELHSVVCSETWERGW
jgi:hypothetical protein